MKKIVSIFMALAVVLCVPLFSGCDGKIGLTKENYSEYLIINVDVSDKNAIYETDYYIISFKITITTMRRTKSNFEKTEILFNRPNPYWKYSCNEENMKTALNYEGNSKFSYTVSYSSINGSVSMDTLQKLSDTNNMVKSITGYVIKE